jgi:hypothetical protein
MSLKSRVSASTASKTILALTAAVVAAALVFFITWAVTDERRYLALSEDLVRNVLITGLIGAGSSWLDANRQRQRQLDDEERVELRNRGRVLRLSTLTKLAATAWNFLPDDPEDNDTTGIAAATQLREAAESLRQQASVFITIHEGDRGERGEESLAVYKYRSSYRALYRYVGEGQRIRRFQQLERISQELRDVAETDDEKWAEVVSRFRRAEMLAQGWRSHTDTVIAERIVVGKVLDHRFERPSGDFRGILAKVDLDASMMSFEPVWMLIAYVALTSGTKDYERLNENLGNVNRCFGSLRNEIRMIAAAYDALADVLALAGDEAEGVRSGERHSESAPTVSGPTDSGRPTRRGLVSRGGGRAARRGGRAGWFRTARCCSARAGRRFARRHRVHRRDATVRSFVSLPFPTGS